MFSSEAAMIHYHYRSEAKPTTVSQNDDFQVPEDVYLYSASPEAELSLDQQDFTGTPDQTTHSAGATEMTTFGEWDNCNFIEQSVPTGGTTALPDPLDWVEESLGPISYFPAAVSPSPFEELPAGLSDIDISDLLPFTGQSTIEQEQYEVEPIPHTQAVMPERKASRTQDLLTTYKKLGARGPPTRRGRPMKQTSDSKMANYARNYREMKKAQLNASEQIIEQLQEENDQLRLENERVLESFKRLEAELGQLRSLMDNQGSQQHLQNYHQTHEFVKEVDDSVLYY